jgi:hypothetical protein
LHASVIIVGAIARGWVAAVVISGAIVVLVRCISKCAALWCDDVLVAALDLNCCHCHECADGQN